MPKTVILHLQNEDPIVAEVDELPGASDTMVKLSSVRLLDGKNVQFVTPGAIGFMFPLHRISFIEVMSGEEEQREVVDFFRE
jgi:hypothetical protein